MSTSWGYSAENGKCIIDNFTTLNTGILVDFEAVYYLVSSPSS